MTDDYEKRVAEIREGLRRGWTTEEGRWLGDEMEEAEWLLSEVDRQKARADKADAFRREQVEALCVENERLQEVAHAAKTRADRVEAELRVAYATIDWWSRAEYALEYLRGIDIDDLQALIEEAQQDL